MKHIKSWTLNILKTALTFSPIDAVYCLQLFLINVNFQPCGLWGEQTEMICAAVCLGPCHYQPPGQHLPSGVEGQVARNTPSLRGRRCRGLLLHHQAAGQCQQPVRGPLFFTAGVKGDQACCRKQGVLSKTQRCMLILFCSSSPPSASP